MDSNKVYEDIVYLLYNILDNEKLKYELYKDKNYRELYLQAVNDLLTLEKDAKASFNDEQWAMTFGKAIVVISRAKQRLEKQDGKSVEKIYEDYSKLIAFSVNSFEVKRDVLTNSKLKFTKDDVLYNGRLSEDTIKQYDDLAKEETKAQASDNVFVNDADQKAKPEDETSQNNANQGYNPFGGQPNGQAYQDFANNMPINPMQDPRFYPFDRKPKWMPALKIALGVITILTAVLLIIASAFALSKSINLHDATASIGGWEVNQSVLDANNGKIKQLSDININWSIATGSKNAAMNIIAFIFYCIPAVYVGYMCFRKPRSLADKYRIGYWSVIFMVVFFALSIIDNYQYASTGQLKNDWISQIKTWVTPGTASDGKPAAGTNFDQGAFDAWWSSVVSSQKLNAVTILMDVAIGFLGLSVIFGIVICFLNPHIDKMKYEKAQNEYQRAVMSAMQGIPYTMDQSLFEDDDNVIIHNKSKFTLWLEKIWNKIAFWKHKKNNKKDK